MAAEELYQQMYCCLSCCGPFRPSREALRSNSMSSKAFYYIEGQAVRNAHEWNCSAPPVLVGPVNRSHIFHEANVIPVMHEFYETSLRNKWRNQSTNGFGVAHPMGVQIPFPAANPGNWMTVISNVNQQKLVTWRSPAAIPNIDAFHITFRECCRRSNNQVSYMPNIEQTPAICQPCNDIMTQLGTTSEFLVRSRIVVEPLVPRRAIEFFDARLDANGVTPTSNVQYTPTYQNNRTRNFLFQACMAYAIHRCLPTSQFITHAASPFQTPLQRNRAHQVYSAFGFILIEILSLMIESTYGTQAGRQILVKPRYRYRGLIEFYISYVIWIFLKNDIAEGEPPNSPPACGLDLHTFHRYFFGTFLDAIVVAMPEYAHAVYITDVIFEQNWMVAGAAPFVPGMELGNPAEVLGYIANSISQFYENIVRPYFSRHVAALLPNPNLAVPATEGEYLRQVTVYNMMIAVPDLVNLLHVCDRANPGDSDSFINLVGVHAVLSSWDKILTAAPQRITKLLDSFVDSVTMAEYTNIMNTLQIKEKSAEAVYLECYALDEPHDPKDEDELNALRSAVKCSAFKAAARLIQCGAFKQIEE